MLAACLDDREAGEGCWGLTYASLSTADMMILNDTEEFFMGVPDVVGKVIFQGGQAVVQFNKNLGFMVKKWAIMKKQIERKIEKKRIGSKEKTALENMIKGTQKILDEFSKDFSATNYSKAAIQTMIIKFDDKLMKALLGSRSCKEVSTKLKGLIRSNRNLTSVSWATLSTYKPRLNEGQRGGFSGQRHNNNSNKNFQGQNKGKSPYPGQFGGYKPKSNAQNGQNGQSNNAGKNQSSSRF